MNIYNLTYAELEKYFLQNSENKAKAKIVYNYLYKDRPHTLSERVWRGVERDFTFSGAEIIDVKSDESAVKFLYKLHDNNCIESVLMKHAYGNALCISTQVGCNMGCAFCASGVSAAQNGKQKIRNLEVFEMVLQILKVQEEFNENITRVTLMGIGEPLDNFDNIVKFISIIKHKHGLTIAPRHITVSTCGLAVQIKKLSEIDCNLAVSLHAPNDEIRSRLMPINKAYNIAELLSAVQYFGRKATLEYILLDGVNDTDENAYELTSLIKNLNCYVNIIPYNETNLGFKRSSDERIKSFYSILIQNKIRAVVRKEFGTEIKAACGQLRAERNENK